MGCDIGTGVLNRIPVDKEGVIANIAGNEKDSLLAGQGLIIEKSAPVVVSPGRVVQVPADSRAKDIHPLFAQSTETEDDLFLNKN